MADFYLPQLEKLPKNLAVTIGNFDGVHRGHQAVLAALAQIAGGRSMLVITFDPHPAQFGKQGSRFVPLMTSTVKKNCLTDLGIDYVVTIPVTKKFLNLSPHVFWQALLRIKPAALLVGHDFRFGYQRQGSVQDLENWAQIAALRFQAISDFHVSMGGQKVAVHSYLIRQYLENPKRVNMGLDLLGHPLALTGIVSRGFGRGRDLGFPTANLDSIETLIPADGVYASTVTLNGKAYPVAVSIGTLPTFGHHPRQIEGHLLNYQGNLSGKKITFMIERYLRPQIKFDSVSDLVNQITKDIAKIRQSFIRSNDGKNVSFL